MPARNYRQYNRPEAERRVIGELRDGTRTLEVAVVASGIRVTQKTDFAKHFVQVPANRAEELAGLIRQAALAAVEGRTA